MLANGPNARKKSVFHQLPLPTDDEKLPVCTGGNPVVYKILRICSLTSLLAFLLFNMGSIFFHICMHHFLAFLECPAVAGCCRRVVVAKVVYTARDLIDTHQVEAILGQNTLEEVVSIAEVGGEAQIPTLSLVDSIPQWAIDQQPFLIQASPCQFAQMKAVAAILQSWGWHCPTLNYKEINSASSRGIPQLLDSVREVGADIGNLVELSSSLIEELQRLKKEQCSYF